MLAEKTVRLHILRCGNQMDRGKEAQAIISRGLIDFGVVQAALGKRVPVRDYEGHGGGITPVKAEGLRDGNREQAHGAVAVYFENCKG